MCKILQTLSILTLILFSAVSSAAVFPAGTDSFTARLGVPITRSIHGDFRLPYSSVATYTSTGNQAVYTITLTALTGLDIQAVNITDENGAAVMYSSSTSGTTQTISVNLAAGTYTIEQVGMLHGPYCISYSRGRCVRSPYINQGSYTFLIS